MRPITSLLIAAALVAALVASAPAGVTAIANPHDINGDGFGDVLIGVPNEGVGVSEQAGIAHAIYGSESGLVRAGNQGFGQAGPVPGSAEQGDLFGGSVALVDVDNDGYADAIIGSPGETLDSAISAGMVVFVPGSDAGLDLESAEVYRQGRRSVPDDAEFGDWFGWSIAAGDFDGDGYGDAAVSAPFETHGSGDTARSQAGAVTILYGSASGIDESRSKSISQAGRYPGGPEADDFFGWSLAVGDFDGDGRDDLAVGVPGEDIGDLVDAGAVNIIYGSPVGLRPGRSRSLSQRAAGGGTEVSDVFGFAVGTGDINCDGIDDLFVGAPNEDIGEPNAGGISNAGAINVVLGSPDGLTETGATMLWQGHAGVAGITANNLSGKVVAGGDFDGDGCDDLVFGSPVQDVGTASGAGAITVVYGTEGWPTIDKSRAYSQAGRVRGAPEPDDAFGSALVVVDINGDGSDDLVVGVPGEGLSDRDAAGGVNVLFGSRSGLLRRDGQFFSQAGSIYGKVESGDRFGSALQDGIA